MKGLTKLLRSLGIGEQITVTDTARADIHRTATRVGVRVKVEKFVGGFYVTRIDGAGTVEITAGPEVDSDFDFGA